MQKNTNENYKKEHQFIDKVLDIFKESALFLLIAITMTLIITNALFIFKITITKYHLPIIYILSIIGYMIWKRKKWKESLISIMIASIVFASSSMFIGRIYDGTADGNTYHKLAVGSLKNGWNPVYQNVEEFNKKEGNAIDIYEDNVNVKWVNHYARGTETFAAVVYAFSGKIETGKVYNILWLYISMFILFGILKQMKLNTWKSMIVAAIMAFNPITLVQITNYYLDGVLTLSLFIIILCCLLKLKKLERDEEIDNYLLLFLSLIWAINSKFNGLAFAAVFCGVYYLYQHIRNFVKYKNIFKKELIRDTVFYVVTVMIAILVVGSSTYTKNMIDHGNPLYPLYGKGHVESMVMMEIPKSLQKENSLTIFLTSIFAKGENVSPSYSSETNEPDLKIPFTTSKEEIDNYSIPDIRMGGFGPMFSGIFILTIIGIVIMIVEYVRKKEYEILIPLGITLVTMTSLVLLLEGGYWSRYICYIYILPVFVLIYLFQKDFNINKKSNIFALIIVTLFAINSLLIIKTQYHSVKANNEYVQIRLERFKEYASNEENVKINLAHHGIQGVEFNLNDLKIRNYQLTDEKLNNDGYMFSY